MVTSRQTELNPNHQTPAEDMDVGIDYEQVVKMALQGGVCLQQLGRFHFGCFYLLVFSFFFPFSC